MYGGRWSCKFPRDPYYVVTTTAPTLDGIPPLPWHNVPTIFVQSLHQLPEPTPHEAGQVLCPRRSVPAATHITWPYFPLTFDEIFVFLAGLFE